jgi:hypothetical protein
MNEAKKVPKTKYVFGDLSQIRLALSQYPSSIQTITVGSGITPDHAFWSQEACFRIFASKLAESICSWAIPPIGNCTLPRRFLFGCFNYNVYNVPYLVLR